MIPILSTIKDSMPYLKTLHEAAATDDLTALTAKLDAGEHPNTYDKLNPFYAFTYENAQLFLKTLEWEWLGSSDGYALALR